MCIVQSLDEILQKCQLKQIDWQCCPGQLQPYWSSAFMSCQLLEKVFEVSSYNGKFVCFLFQFYQVCLMNFDAMLLRCKHIHKCHLFLGNYPFIIIQCSLFSSYNWPWGEVSFAWNECNYSSFHMIGVNRMEILCTYIYVCMCVYIHVCVYIYTHTHLF